MIVILLLIAVVVCVRLIASGLRDMTGKDDRPNVNVNIRIENSFNGGDSYDEYRETKTTREADASDLYRSGGRSTKRW